MCERVHYCLFVCLCAKITEAYCNKAVLEFKNISEEEWQDGANNFYSLISTLILDTKFGGKRLQLFLQLHLHSPHTTTAQKIPRLAKFSRIRVQYDRGTQRGWVEFGVNMARLTPLLRPASVNRSTPTSALYEAISGTKLRDELRHIHRSLLLKRLELFRDAHRTIVVPTFYTLADYDMLYGNGRPINPNNPINQDDEDYAPCPGMEFPNGPGQATMSTSQADTQGSGQEQQDFPTTSKPSSYASSSALPKHRRTLTSAHITADPKPLPISMSLNTGPKNTPMGVELKEKSPSEKVSSDSSRTPIFIAVGVVFLVAFILALAAAAVWYKSYYVGVITVVSIKTGDPP